MKKNESTEHKRNVKIMFGIIIGIVFVVLFLIFINDVIIQKETKEYKEIEKETFTIDKETLLKIYNYSEGTYKQTYAGGYETNLTNIIFTSRGTFECIYEEEFEFYLQEDFIDVDCPKEIITTDCFDSEDNKMIGIECEIKNDGCIKLKDSDEIILRKYNPSYLEIKGKWINCIECVEMMNIFHFEFYNNSIKFKETGGRENYPKIIKNRIIKQPCKLLK